MDHRPIFTNYNSAVVYCLLIFQTHYDIKYSVLTKYYLVYKINYQLKCMNQWPILVYYTNLDLDGLKAIKKINRKLRPQLLWQIKLKIKLNYFDKEFLKTDINFLLNLSPFIDIIRMTDIPSYFQSTLMIQYSHCNGNMFFVKNN